MNTKNIRKRLVKNAQAVSPIIATLMLVLVSVGAAGAFYLWQTGWQKDVTSSVGSASVQSSLTIGGSSTVYEFLAVAKEIFEAQNPNIKIDIQKGGSGAGISGAGLGLVDIGTASKDATTDANWAKYPDKDRNGVKDLGVEMNQILIGYDGVVIIVPAASTLNSINRTTLQGIYGKTITNWSTVYNNYNSTGGLHAAGAIKIADRSDESGTEECFVDKLAKLSGTYVANKQIQAGWCQISQPSNQQLVAAIAADPNAIGFTAYGIAQNTPSVKVVKFAETVALGLSTGDGLPSAAEIKSGLWPGSRPLNFITIGKPTGQAKVFVDFCLGTQANQDICSLSDYVSIFA